MKSVWHFYCFYNIFIVFFYDIIFASSKFQPLKILNLREVYIYFNGELITLEDQKQKQKIKF